MPIPYSNRNTTGDWSPWFGQWEGQRHDDLDTNCCWAYSGNEVLEDQLEFLWKTGVFSDTDLIWFKDNGYIDSDGDFYLSRRWIPTLSGVKRNGNDQEEFWRITSTYGAIPNAFLPFTNNIDYFDKAFLTDGMYALGRDFNKRVNIAYQELGRRFSGYSLSQLKYALTQSPLQLGIPVPQDGSWNLAKVKYNGSKVAQHSVELFKIDEVADYDYPIFVYDQYSPMIKQLSRDYFIPLCTLAVITPTLSTKATVSVSVFIQFINLLKSLKIRLL